LFNFESNDKEVLEGDTWEDLTASSGAAGMLEKEVKEQMVQLKHDW